MKNWIRTSVAAAVAATVLCATTPAEARLFKLFGAAEEQLPDAPTPAPTLTPMPGTVYVPSPSAPMFAAPGAACCPTPCIKYRNAIFDCKVKCCDPCAPPIKAVLHVMNPCTCCPVDVPVCLPNCCCGEPCIEGKKTLFGAGMVSYKWCCGVTVNVRFDKCGDVLVTYRGT